MTTYQAVVKVTDSVRELIRKGGDKLLIGLYSCRIYDQVSPKRCNKCQHFGHWVKECKENPACAICGSSGHETDNCSHKDETSFSVTCVNCTRSNKPGNGHRADSSYCPCFIEKREALKLELNSKKKALNY